MAPLTGGLPPAAEDLRQIERSIIKKFRKPIWRRFTKAINEYELIKDGDRIAVCISGGKDSMLMAKLFQELLRHGKKNFSLEFLVMNPGYNEINRRTIMSNADRLGIPVTVFTSNIFEVVAEEDMDSPCYLCARMRRGYLYSKAKELGCNKIALGHHYDDVIETIVMGMMYGSQIQTMMPKLHSSNFEGMELIRPMYLIRERDIIHWADYNKLTFIRCACILTERLAAQAAGKQSESNREGAGSGQTDNGRKNDSGQAGKENDTGTGPAGNKSDTGTGPAGNEVRDGSGQKEMTSKRTEIKELLARLEEKDPVIVKNIFRSVENVNLATIIAYKEKGVKHHFLDTYDC